jgi:monothiol glutaredoxin
MKEIFQKIDSEIKSNDIVIFMKGTPDFPQCGFSAAVCSIFDNLGIEFKGINILLDDNLREAIKEYSDWPTLPQIYIKGNFLGGCDIAKEMYESGELEELLKEKGII